jgi:hypothetical protein
MEKLCFLIEQESELLNTRALLKRRLMILMMLDKIPQKTEDEVNLIRRIMKSSNKDQFKKGQRETKQI